jgi:hypothetical protein
MQSMILGAEIIGRLIQHGNAFASLLVLQTNQSDGTELLDVSHC